MKLPWASRRRKARGYTAVELMMALGLFGVGVSGIIAMQKLTVTSNSHAKNLALATHIAQAWLDQLAIDATLWNAPAAAGGVSDIGDTSWVELSNDSDTNGVWQLPAYDADRRFGPAFNALGAPLDSDDADQARFCTHVRLTTLYPADGQKIGLNGRETLAGNGLVRAEVRVFWLRDGATALAGVCDPENGPGLVDDVEAAGNAYHRVYKVTAVRQHSTTR